MTFANERRGLRLSGTDFTYLSEGAYSVVFADRERRQVRKVYRVHGDAGLDHCRDVFAAEIDAYQIASNNAELRGLVPRYFGPCPNQVIVDGTPSEVTKEFHPDLAFEAEFVECQFHKLGVVPPPDWARIVVLFRRNGIHHVNGASFCLWDGRVTKVIDFTTKEVELWQ